MTYSQVDDMVAEIGVPYAYFQFPEGTAQSCPFVCFYFAGSVDFLADDANYQPIRQLIVELYTDAKDFAMEATVEAVLTAHGLVFARSEAYIDVEKMNMVSYATAIVVTPEPEPAEPPAAESPAEEEEYNG